MPEPKATWSPEGLSGAMTRLVTVPHPAGLKPEAEVIPDLVKDLIQELLEKVQNPEVLLMDSPDPLIRQMPIADREQLADQLSQHPTVMQVQEALMTGEAQNKPARASNPEPVETLQEWLEMLVAAAP